MTTQQETSVEDTSTFLTTVSRSQTSLGTTESEVATIFRRNLTEMTPTLALSTTTPHQTSGLVLTLFNSTLQPDQTTINNSSLLNISDQDKSQYLAYLQEQTTKGMIPAMVYLIILAVVGFVGNCLVLFVYSQKFKQTSTRVFIMAIACFDIITNVIAIPGEIYDMFHIWDFDQPMVCKTRLFFNAFTTMVAAMVLVAVAVVRYRKICKPFKKQVTIKMARIISVILAMLSLLFSIPYALINGRQTKPTPQNGTMGYECTIDDSYVGTIWPLMNGAFFIFLFIVCSIPLVVMYIMIGVTAWKHSKIYGVTTQSKSKPEARNSDSGHTNEMGTKSTEDSPLKFPKSPKTRSFVKMKGGSTSEPVSESCGKENDGGTSSVEKERQQYIITHSSKTQNSHDDDNNTTDVDDTNKEENIVANNNNFSVRMIRSPTGEKVNVNLCMVRELTVKLKAVKKEVESRTKYNDDSGNDSENADVELEISSQKLNKLKEGENVHEESESLNKSDINKSRNGSKHLKKHRNKSADNNLYIDLRQTLSSCPSRRISKSVDDLTRLVEKRPNIVKELAKLKAAEHEDLDLRAEANSLVESLEPANHNEAESPKDEPVSEFAKVMQWVDLTYCLQEDNKDSENTKNESNCEEFESTSLSKKGSFAMARKISRDNSFLQRHRKLKDALTDTLTRARKSRREREASEAEGRENYGNFALENINSESENTCNNEDSDLATKDTTIQSNNERQDDKAYKRKASNAIENIPNGEFGNKVKLNAHRGRRQGIGRTTAMLILISAVYILGFLPYLGLSFAKYASPATFESMDMAPFAVYNLFLRSYFLNSAANPIIYSLCDMNFRRECFGLLKCS
ncbi:unnamed protein product [Candidula unifasciata]|uniref:G-protein coupled receptors family 1 profile domain-containing protein n=1 Tax=Candidula unifasciata TaxID=100452 RepID=A0A8S3Z1C3_9EUPU|nr:unnamed protein product [Candidula unifasciata]